MHHAAVKTNHLTSPTHSFSISPRLAASSASVHPRGRRRSAQELRMSELAEPYLKIARFCKELIFSMGRYGGAVAGASLGRLDSGGRRGTKTKVADVSAEEPVFWALITPSRVLHVRFAPTVEGDQRGRAARVERKHWQTHMAHRKIHQHGKSLPFPHTRRPGEEPESVHVWSATSTTRD